MREIMANSLENFNTWKPGMMKDHPRISCVYMIEITGKYYIGLTTDLYKRVKNHIADRNKRNHIPLYKWMVNKPMNEQKVYILHVETDINKLKELEKKEILERDTLFPKGLNCNGGGG
jgi:predicted GIY-YIG superfamily endonuclease